MLEDKDCVVSVVTLEYALMDSQTLINLNDICCVRPQKLEDKSNCYWHGVFHVPQDYIVHGLPLHTLNVTC